MCSCPSGYLVCVVPTVRYTYVVRQRVIIVDLCHQRHVGHEVCILDGVLRTACIVPQKVEFDHQGTQMANTAHRHQWVLGLKTLKP